MRRLFVLAAMVAAGYGSSAVLPSACALSASEPASSVAASIERLRPRVIATYPHDPAAFTQGLLWHQGSLYESTGLYGESSVRRVELATGRVQTQVALPGHLWGEGLARVDDHLVQLTWREGVARVLDLASLQPVAEHRYSGEGWGLCFDGVHLVMSDGGNELVFRDPTTFIEARRAAVTLDGAPLPRLNELECVDGWVYANVWGTDWIVRIEPASGVVRTVIDASGLLPAAERVRTDVLNGIAFDPERRLFLLTGKLWPSLFAVEFEAP